MSKLQASFHKDVNSSRARADVYGPAFARSQRRNGLDRIQACEFRRVEMAAVPRQKSLFGGRLESSLLIKYQRSDRAKVETFGFLKNVQRVYFERV
jgi:hypothetical protein